MEHQFIGNAITGGTYCHIYDCIQASMRKSKVWLYICIRSYVDTIESRKMPLISATNKTADTEAHANLASDKSVVMDTTSSVTFNEYVPAMLTDTISGEIGIIEQPDVPASISRPGSRPLIPKPGTAAYSRCVEQC